MPLENEAQILLQLRLVNTNTIYVNYFKTIAYLRQTSWFLPIPDHFDHARPQLNRM